MSTSQADLLFYGNASIQQPNHITRYIYPALLGYPYEYMRMQRPENPENRTRPQGPGSWGEDGHTYLTISPATLPPPASPSAHESVSAAAEREKDHEHANPLGRAMARVSRYIGNTLLETGKFELEKDVLFFCVRRTTVVLVRGGGWLKERDFYAIRATEWRSMRPPDAGDGQGQARHDGWWERLQALYSAGSDRAFWSARENLSTLGLPAPILPWRWRGDVEEAVTVIREKVELEERAGDGCMVCSMKWFDESDHVCRLKCGHCMCIECLTTIVDFAGRGNFTPEEEAAGKDPGVKFWRCPLCKDINGVLRDRADIIAPDELPWWKWKICMRRLEKEAKDYWLFRLAACAEDRWSAAMPDDMDHNQIQVAMRVRIHYDDAVELMETIPIFVQKLLPFGFVEDNPAYTEDGISLKGALQRELLRLQESQKEFNTQELIRHMSKMAKRAMFPAVLQDREARLGNPILPPGYSDYSKFLAEWTARVCFLSPRGRSDLLGFLQKMRDEDWAWWKDERDVFFNP
ncbi:hypothetical protein BS50DRAFT_619787 [Corynespora cassiicola Philippines]|uniref:RING-type domain-containing protein n=1 Tax=Corynespora cassiicola Philippines TaxID=1448308 RepID=A0A2T2NUN6_CORCC|nr:hypothetical protein BS50DRAFT_619787 [Corynespora cassiicola Philippines]